MHNEDLHNALEAHEARAFAKMHAKENQGLGDALLEALSPEAVKDAVKFAEQEAGMRAYEDAQLSPEEKLRGPFEYEETDDNNDKWKVKKLCANVPALRDYYKKCTLDFDEGKDSKCVECRVGRVTFQSENGVAKYKCHNAECGISGDIFSIRRLIDPEVELNKWGKAKEINKVWGLYGKWEITEESNAGGELHSSSPKDRPHHSRAKEQPAREHNETPPKPFGRTEWIRKLSIHAAMRADERMLAQIILDSADGISTDADYYAGKCAVEKRYALRWINDFRAYNVFNITRTTGAKDYVRGNFAWQAVSKIPKLNLKLMCLIFARCRQKTNTIDLSNYHRKSAIQVLSKWRARQIIGGESNTIELL